jgi:hypothetical protein
MKHVETLALVFAFSLGSTLLARTQDKPVSPPPPRPPMLAAATPLKVQVVIGRYQGEKKLSSMPYTLTLQAGGHGSLRMGAKIPIAMLTMANVGKDAPAPTPLQYQDVGTNIDCNASEVEGGRFALNITVDDASVYSDDQVGVTKGNPSFRQFRAVNSMLLKNGETGQFTSATDKVTGETIRVDVTLTVIK